MALFLNQWVATQKWVTELFLIQSNHSAGFVSDIVVTWT